MVLKSRVDKVGPVAFVAPTGAITINTDLDLRRSASMAISDPGTCAVFVDLRRVTRIDCAGIGLLVETYRRVRDAGRSFGLVNVKPRQQQLIQLLGLRDHLVNYACRGEALFHAKAELEASLRVLPLVKARGWGQRTGTGV
jgi:anti-anti-sigma factor